MWQLLRINARLSKQITYKRAWAIYSIYLNTFTKGCACKTSLLGTSCLQLVTALSIWVPDLLQGCSKRGRLVRRTLWEVWRLTSSGFLQVVDNLFEICHPKLGANSGWKDSMSTARKQTCRHLFAGLWQTALLNYGRDCTIEGGRFPLSAGSANDGRRIEVCWCDNCYELMLVSLNKSRINVRGQYTVYTSLLKHV